MEWIERMYQYIDDLEARIFMRYALIAGGTLLILCIGLTFYYYRTVHTLNRNIQFINEERERVREILERAQRVKRQQAHVNTMLSENEDFKIAGYFKGVLRRLNLAHKNTTATTTPLDRQDGYREVNLNATFIGMNMKELTELLHELEKTERIYTRDLSIARDKKQPDALEVTITIGTMLVKTAEGTEGLE